MDDGERVPYFYYCPEGLRSQVGLCKNCGERPLGREKGERKTGR